MTHGLAHFRANEIVDKAQGALDLVGAERDGEAQRDAMEQAVRVVLENQMKIAETLDLIKQEFDKFEEGLNKIL